MKYILTILISIFILSCASYKNIGIKLKDKIGITILFDAILKKDYKGVSLALESESANSRTHLFTKKLYDRLGETNTRLFLGIGELDKLESYTISALHAAVYAGDSSIVDLLIKKGANVNEVIRDNSTLIFLVLYNKDYSIFEKFVEGQVDFTKGEITVFENGKFTKKNALQYAEYLGLSNKFTDLIKR